MNHALTQSDIDSLKRSFIEWAFQLDRLDSLEAAEQLLRTRVHPSVYNSLLRMQELLHEEHPELHRRVAERVGYSDIIEMFKPAFGTVERYRHGHGEPVSHSQAYTELLLLAGLFDEQLLARTLAAVISEKGSGQLHSRFASHGADAEQAIQADLFWREIEELNAHAERQQHPVATQVDPVTTMPLDPAIIKVKEAHGAHAYYQVPGTVRVFDPVHHVVDIQYGQPTISQRYDVEQSVSLPRERALNGLTLQFSFQGLEDISSEPIRLRLHAEDMQALAQRGSAVPTRFGRLGDIRVYPEYAVSHTGEIPALPAEHVASMRITPTFAEIRALQPYCRLTVWV